MALKKITEEEMNAQGVIAAPDILNGTPAQNKAIFDRMVRNLVAPAVNACAGAVDEVNANQEEWGKQEQTREANEEGRETEEVRREEAEAIRETNEMAREQAEENRSLAEGQRAAAEQARREAEEIRQAKEQERDNAERGRAADEATRRGSEENRTEAESKRAQAEELRNQEETERKQAEEKRSAAETIRENNETNRKQAEVNRAAAEAGRIAAEQERVDTNNGIVAQATAAAKRAEDSAKEVMQAAKPPYIGENGNWFVWDEEKAAFVDSDTRAKGDKPVAGTDYWTEADKAEIAEEASKLVYVPEVVQETGESEAAVMSQKAVTDKFNGYVIPDYWRAYLDGKISDIKALQDVGGKDCFSFVVMTDLHYPSNLGKRSPDLARKIMEEINAKYAFCLGDVQTRGCWHTKEEVLDELAEVEAFFAPIKDRLLRTQGNHDGSYGWLDRDGDGQYTNAGKEPSDRETYVYNLTPAEIFERIYRPNGMVGDIHTDESGTGYYIDDTANRVRYIVLNTQKNDYELQEDGTQKYPNMWLFRFTQSQFDFLTNEALVTGLTDKWSVVALGHCPLYQEIGDREVMQGVLNAYKNKATYTGKYAGTAGGGTHIVKEYTNLAEPLPNNTTDTSKWVNGYRYSSSGISAQSGTTISNHIPCKVGDVVRIKGVTLRANTDRLGLYYTHEGVAAEGKAYWDATHQLFSCELVNDVYVLTIKQHEDYVFSSIRFAMPTPEDASAVIVTVNEEIKETVVTTGGYDSVSVDVDFSNAKGNLVGYFAGHVHVDNNTVTGGVPVITTRCDGKQENTDALKAERVEGTTTEQSFDVFTVNTKTKTIHATKIGAGSDRTISY